MALNTVLTLKLAATLSSALDLVTANAPLSIDWSDSLATGTGADQADLIFSDTRTLAGSTAENIDLAGVLTNALGATLTFVKIKMILIRAGTANNGNLAIGNHATAAFVNWVANATDIVNIRPGGIFLLWTPDVTAYAVTATTGDLLKIENLGAGSGTYEIIIIGTSA